MLKLERFRPIILFCVAVAALAIFAVSAFRGGPIIASDTPSFTTMAEVFLSSGFDFGSVMDAKRESQNPTIFYAMPVLLFSALAGLPAWEHVFIAINAGLVLLGMLLMWQMLAAAGARVLTMVACAGLLAVSDATVWVRYVLSDPLYFFAVVLVASRAWRYVQETRTWPWLLLAVLFAVFTRPASPGLIVGLLLGLGLLALHADNWRRGLTPLAFFLLLIGATGTFALGVTTAEWMDSHYLAFIRRMAVEGQVIYARPDTWLPPSGAATSFAALFLTRFAAFFTFWVGSFSLAHNVATAVVIGAFLLSVILSIAETPASTANYRLRILLAAIIFGGAVYTSATLLDFDWRYRFPYLGLMIVFSGLTLELWGRRLLPILSVDLATTR